MAHILSELNTRRRYERINAWLQSPGGADVLSPSDSVHNAVYTFAYQLKNHELKLKLHIDVDALANKACTYVCRLYETRHSDDILYHRAQISYPENWTSEHEALWIDYMRHVFDSSWWHTFWKQMRPADWEWELPDWRCKLQELFVEYIDRDKNVLIRANVMDPEPDQTDDWE